MNVTIQATDNMEHSECQTVEDAAAELSLHYRIRLPLSIAKHNENTGKWLELLSKPPTTTEKSF